MNNSKNRFFIFLIYTTAILFLILYTILSFHSRLAGDDFFYLWLNNKFGAWKGMMYQYNAWSGRWAAHSLGCLMIPAWRNPFFLPSIHFVTLALLYVSLYKLFLKFLSSFRINVEKNILPAFIILIITSFFFTSYNIGETWFWYIIIITYLWSIISFIILINCIFSVKNNILNYLLIIICPAFIGGASESYALIFLWLLFCLLVYRWIIMKGNLNESVILKIIFALIILSISFSFSAYAPGTEIRHSLLPQTTLPFKFLVSIKAFLKFFIRFLPSKFIYIILFSLPWIYFGSVYLKNKINTEEAKKIIIKITFIFILALALMLIPTSFIMSETGPGRALSVISIATTIYFAIIFSLTGVYIDFNKIIHRSILTTVSFVATLILIYTIYTQFLIVGKFTKAYSERLNKIENAKRNNFTGVLLLDKMPPQGMLYWDEISDDTSYYTNQHLRDGLDLPFNVKLRNQ